MFLCTIKPRSEREGLKIVIPTTIQLVLPFSVAKVCKKNETRNTPSRNMMNTPFSYTKCANIPPEHCFYVVIKYFSATYKYYYLSQNPYPGP